MNVEIKEIEVEKTVKVIERRYILDVSEDEAKMIYTLVGLCTGKETGPRGISNIIYSKLEPIFGKWYENSFYKNLLDYKSIYFN